MALSYNDYENTIVLCKAVTSLYVDLIENEQDRIKIDGFIGEYVGFIKTLTRQFDHDNFDANDFQLRLATYLKRKLKNRKKIGKSVGYSSTLKFAYDKLNYKDVEDIN